MTDVRLAPMNEARRLHREAMAIADQAVASKRRGDLANAVGLFRDAHGLESLAAALFAGAHDLEPTRSVLHRSAASLALDCGDYQSAERHIAVALSGYPPDPIAGELRDLMETVYFQRHLDLRGVRLEPDEFQFTIEGQGVGFGIAPADQFVGRVRTVETLIYRTAERKLDRPFRESGRRKKALDEKLQLFVSVPRAASFAVTFRVGASAQAEFPEMSFPAEVVRELLATVELVNRGEMEQLEERIGNEAYFNNFVGLVQQIAPDGEIIRSVGFTSLSSDGEDRVSLTVPKKKITPRAKPSVPRIAVSDGTDIVGLPGQQQVELRGTLLEADATGIDSGSIEIRSEDGSSQRVTVPRGMMRDIVKPYFEEDVVVIATRIGTTIYLDSIGHVDEA